MEASNDLPVDVFTELGRVTWAAIMLEDSIKWLCSLIWPHDPRTSPTIGKMLGNARSELSRWPSSPARKDALGWLDHADKAIEARNAILHATPLTLADSEAPEESPRQFLGEMPRRSGQPYQERPMTVESLVAVRDLLAEAAAGWREVILAVAEARIGVQAPGGGR